MRARVNGQVVALADNLALDRQIKHNIEVVIDRLKAGPGVRPRLAEAVEAALKLGEGTVIVAREGAPDLLLSSHYACAACGLGFDPPSPQLFSFNSPQGMCPACDGIGVRHDFDPDQELAQDVEVELQPAADSSSGAGTIPACRTGPRRSSTTRRCSWRTAASPRTSCIDARFFELASVKNNVPCGNSNVASISLGPMPGFCPGVRHRRRPAIIR